MKNIVIIIFTLFFVTEGEAQSTVGVRSGVFFSKMIFFSDEEQFFKSNDASYFEIGLVSAFKLGQSISLNPEINFIQKGGERGESPNLITHRFKGVEFVVPMNLSLEFKRVFLKIETGLYGGMFFKGQAVYSSSNDINIEFNNISHGGFKRRDFGAVIGAGAGVNVKNYSFSLNWRYRQPILYNAIREFEDSSPIQQIKFVGWGIAAMVSYEL